MGSGGVTNGLQPSNIFNPSFEGNESLCVSSRGRGFSVLANAGSDGEDGAYLSMLVDEGVAVKSLRDTGVWWRFDPQVANFWIRWTPVNENTTGLQIKRLRDLNHSGRASNSALQAIVCPQTSICHREMSPKLNSLQSAAYLSTDCECKESKLQICKIFYYLM